MKLNYYAYTVTFKDTGVTANICIADIVHFYCKCQKEESVLEKYREASSKKLYLARAESFASIYYLMSPASLINYKTLNKGSGIIKDLNDVLEDGDSLEKLTYVHFDDKISMLGVTSSSGGASVEDLQYYLNEMLNGLHLKQTHKYEVKIFPLQSKVPKSSVTSLKFISEATVVLNESTGLAGIVSGLIAGGASNNVEVSISIKRTGKKKGIEKSIKPLLDIIESDTNDDNFSKVHLRAKRDNLNENIKDYFLDQSSILFDIINPYQKSPVENQIQEKSYMNYAITEAHSSYIASLGDRASSEANCVDWSKLTDSKSYEPLDES
jgi:hypothetical protein